MSKIAKDTAAKTAGSQRSRGYLVYLIIFMGLVALMDQYLSTIKTTALPYILEEYNISPTQFSNLEGIFFILTFFIFLLKRFKNSLKMRFFYSITGIGNNDFNHILL